MGIQQYDSRFDATITPGIRSYNTWPAAREYNLLQAASTSI
jgi:hypothetical protein